MTGNDYQLGRRRLMLGIFNTTTKLIVANAVVYEIGSVFKELDGKLIAGAKTCGWVTTFAAPESSCFFEDPAPPEPCSNGMTWYGCATAGSPGIVENKECQCN